MFQLTVTDCLPHQKCCHPHAIYALCVSICRCGPYRHACATVTCAQHSQSMQLHGQAFVLQVCTSLQVGFWLCCRWGIAYGDITRGNPFIGTDSYGLANWESNVGNSGSTGRWADWFYQWAFAATATTIPAGCVAERFNFNAYLGESFIISCTTACRAAELVQPSSHVAE